MKKLLSNRAVLAGLVVVALVAGIAIGGAFFARTITKDGSNEEAASSEAETTTSSTTPAVEDPESADVGAEGQGDLSGRDGESDGAAAEPVIPTDPTALRAVQPVNVPGYSYKEPENSPTPLPPFLPVDVTLSSTENLRPGDAIRIRAEGKDGSQMFGFRARLCKQDAELEGLYDFFPTVAPNCIANPLGPGTDAYVEVQSPEPRVAAEGAFRVGLGTDTFPLEDGGQGSVTCSKQSPCQLVLQVHVPYGFGYLRYNLSFA